MFTLRNDGFLPLAIKAPVLSSSDFKVSGLVAKVLQPGELMTFSVTFAPRSLGTRTAILTVVSDDVDEARIPIRLSGLGVR